LINPDQHEDSPSPIREIVKSKSQTKTVIAEREERPYKINRLNYDGNSINPSRNNEEVTMTIKSFGRVNRNVPLLRKKH